MTAPSPTRREFDFYPTPAWMVDHLTDRLAFIPYGDVEVWKPGRIHPRGPIIVEPCVGQGNIVNAIRRVHTGATFHTADIDHRHEADVYGDATDPAALIWKYGDIDWVVTNPPFSAAFDIVRNAFEVARIGVAMLLRVTWLEPPKSAENRAKAFWLKEHPPTWELIMERTSFDGAGQDSATTAWFVWFKDTARNTQRIEIIPGRGKQEPLL